MWQRMKSWGTKTWAAIAAVVLGVLAVVAKLVMDRREANSADTVTKAEDAKVTAEFKDGTAAAVVVAAAEATETAVRAQVTEAVAAGPDGSSARVAALDTEVSDMSRRRHDEALARAARK